MRSEHKTIVGIAFALFGPNVLRMLGMNPFVYVEFSAEALSLGLLGLPGLFAPLRRLCLLGLLRLQWHFFNTATVPLMITLGHLCVHRVQQHCCRAARNILGSTPYQHMRCIAARCGTQGSSSQTQSLACHSQNIRSFALLRRTRNVDS